MELACEDRVVLAELRAHVLESYPPLGVDSEFGHVFSVLVGQRGNPPDQRDETVLDALDPFAVAHVFSPELVREALRRAGAWAAYRSRTRFGVGVYRVRNDGWCCSHHDLTVVHSALEVSMISFAFFPRGDDPSWRGEWISEIPLYGITKNDFVFYYFNVDVVISDGENDVLLSDPVVSVVDFVLMLGLLRHEVSRLGASIVMTSRINKYVFATKQGGDVELSYSFSPVVSCVSADDIERAPVVAARAALDVLYGAREELRSNPFLAGLVDMVRAG